MGILYGERNMRIFIVLMTVFILTACGSPTKGQGVDKQSETGIKYRLVTLEGMPCLIISSPTSDGFAVDSITCDWSKYKEKK